MKAILNLIGLTVGGWIGWAIGAPISIFTAYVISTVGSALGLYAAIRVTKYYLP
jgi:hypothetical protein